MTRTTISLHESVLKKVRGIAHQSHITMGEAITELLTLGIESKASHHATRAKRKFSLKSYSMGSPRIPLEDKDALNAILDGRQE